MTDRMAPFKASPIAAIGRRVRQRRLELGLTGQQLGKKIGRSKGTVSNWERDLTPVPPEMYHLIASALHCSIEWITLGNRGKGAGRIQVTAEVRSGGMIAQVKDGKMVERPHHLSGRRVDAVEVTTDQLSPRYNKGDILYVAKAGDFDMEDCVGLDCLVHLAADHQLIRTLEPGNAAGRYTLTSPAHTPITGVAVVEACPILAHIHAIALKHPYGA